jgi:large subunit ribosomal protein L21
MYAVIKTGGKQYRVKPGDVLVVEKLDGEPGAKVAFEQVLMVGEGDNVTVGAPLVEGASVNATLIETRKGEKVKIFKKIRRQGYRRTRGHRQPESVFRVTSLVAGGKTESWDGEVSLTTLAELNLRARNLARVASTTPAAIEVETVVEPQGKGKAPRAKARVVESAEPLVADAAVAAAEAELHAEAAAAAPAKKSAAKKPAAKKAAPAGKGPSAKDVAKSGAPKQTRAQARAPVRRTAPRGNKG